MGSGNWLGEAEARLLLLLRGEPSCCRGVKSGLFGGLLWGLVWGVWLGLLWGLKLLELEGGVGEHRGLVKLVSLQKSWYEPVHELGVSGRGGRTMIRWESSDRLRSMEGMGPFLLPTGHVLLLGSFSWSPGRWRPALVSGLSGFRCGMRRRMLKLGRENMLEAGIREMRD